MNDGIDILRDNNDIAPFKNIYNMVHSLSESVIMPIAGVILAFVMTLELIQLIVDKNNMNDVDTWLFFRWIFKTACAVIIVTNTWNIVMGVFDAAQSVVNSAAGVALSEAQLDINSIVTGLEARLMEMDIGPLFGLWFQTLFVGVCILRRRSRRRRKEKSRTSVERPA